jgi:hypothetical protein
MFGQHVITMNTNMQDNITMRLSQTFTINGVRGALKRLNREMFPSRSDVVEI